MGVHIHRIHNDPLPALNSQSGSSDVINDATFARIRQRRQARAQGAPPTSSFIPPTAPSNYPPQASGWDNPLIASLITRRPPPHLNQPSLSAQRGSSQASEPIRTQRSQQPAATPAYDPYAQPPVAPRPPSRIQTPYVPSPVQPTHNNPSTSTTNWDWEDVDDLINPHRTPSPRR
ncbi:hypothetical protein XIS1_300016 [Xenorhabdus innexi]|uniref:Uncharacterized protein n=1 Tax=Xenorhabdus innexi TaxID=290109 RepID=A0A1N6MXD4_9GAMM|nr:hypothetical protein XIS1_300016 [Xenorhabdus innexi]